MVEQNQRQALLAMFSKVLSVMLLVLTVVLLTGCKAAETTSHSPDSQAEVANSIGAPQAIKKMDAHGIIENKAQWQELIRKTDYGAKIKTVRELNQMLYVGNPHSNAVKSVQEIENIQFPTITKVSGIKVVNVPAFYSIHADKRKKYQQDLQQTVDQVSEQPVIVLNFANNIGGIDIDMIGGLAALIPNGSLWQEIDNQGKSWSVKLTNDQITGGVLDLKESVVPVNKRLDKKVLVIMDKRTASAAEVAIIALKRNPLVKIIGRESTGRTSINKSQFIGRKKTVVTLTLGTIESEVPIGGKKSFNNQPLIPDVTTLYQPISPAHGADYQKQEPLDEDFVQELKQQFLELSDATE
ncbi:S41 family peptidase [Lapidilactobacillus wuchangensis]|uniref:S41 family peptidase n=1 Tax=Lapidilactobacillus wuchangensis TaxID=2486001 RepID=UPI000F767870|nr:S41 family peptidase [Lapidilactobacillus wuchangensis]